MSSVAPEPVSCIRCLVCCCKKSLLGWVGLKREHLQLLEVHTLPGGRQQYANLIADPYYVPYKEVTLSPIHQDNLDQEATRLETKAMRSANAYASYAKNSEFRGIPSSVITVYYENNSVTLTLT